MFAKCSLRDILRAALRPRRQPTIRTRTHRVRPAVEWLEGRVVPALQLTYGGPGTALTLSDLAGTQDNVTVLDFAGNVLQINLNGAAFAPGSSTAHVIYEASLASEQRGRKTGGKKNRDNRLFPVEGKTGTTACFQ